MKDRKHQIRTDCSKKMRTPVTSLTGYDPEDQMTYHALVALNMNYHNNYRKLAVYNADMWTFHPVATGKEALDVLMHRRKDDCTFS